MAMRPEGFSNSTPVLDIRLICVVSFISDTNSYFQATSDVGYQA